MRYNGGKMIDKKTTTTEIPETHKEGYLYVENIDVIFPEGIIDKYCDIGLQVARDGRIWLCVDGIAFIRFSPHANGKMKKD